ncbi:MAG: DUF4407 domain-containing protein [Microcystis sp. M048S1]|uniref:DUF4407 domain-containing protein n=1 Tax=unclassified Microcystis TaxID=2643300 RepID=UPI001196B701|nr:MULTISPECIES: DUF4407 domain-containing protein [unclassified Microcystis]MCA2903209.1 DUF4407 domain-containing protein [Microcystis sp. M035S1]MCA2721090.1 DUF4407 domain-containing protein [Microcystis sp. M176S2]MCA2725957.1 DUF4407 domain-containing protein [Microcystis sp. M166S2]MCA2728427.1 DUF4407 domain-containing protein [Microcystis sp. M162S2]MCA2746412.1 DUF4407 domain-containing protein [Microcystis sp. M155S2]
MSDADFIREVEELYLRLANADTDDLVELAKLAGLDPKTDLAEEYSAGQASSDLVDLAKLAGLDPKTDLAEEYSVGQASSSVWVPWDAAAQKQPNKLDQINFLVKFLWFCAGANIKVLERCQVDHNKYAMIGFTVLLTSVAASLSGGYVLWTVFNSTKMAISFGLFWGLMIGNLDRFLVSTTRKEENWSVEKIVFLGVQVLVAISIAFVVAKPLELKILEKPIRAELVEQNSKIALEKKTRLILIYSEISQLEKDNQKLQNNLDKLKQQMNEAYRAVIGEAEGTSGTKKLGTGPVYDKKWQKYQQSLIEYESNKKNLDAQIKENLNRIRKLTEKRDLELANIITEKAKADDIMTQLETLNELGKKKPIYARLSFFIILLFVLIDVSPIIAKLFLKSSLYDCLLDEEEKMQRTLYLQIQEKAQQEAMNNAFQSENYQKAVDDLSKVYTNQLSREISRLGQEFNPAVYKQKIKQEMHKQMENRTIPSIVEELNLPHTYIP